MDIYLQFRFLFKASLETSTNMCFLHVRLIAKLILENKRVTKNIMGLITIENRRYYVLVKRLINLRVAPFTVRVTAGCC